MKFCCDKKFSIVCIVFIKLKLWTPEKCEMLLTEFVGIKVDILLRSDTKFN
jgi:hypothetical protein